MHCPVSWKKNVSSTGRDQKSLNVPQKSILYFVYMANLKSIFEIYLIPSNVSKRCNACLFVLVKLGKEYRERFRVNVPTDSVRKYVRWTTKFVVYTCSSLPKPPSSWKLDWRPKNDSATWNNSLRSDWHGEAMSWRFQSATFKLIHFWVWRERVDIVSRVGNSFAADCQTRRETVAHLTDNYLQNAQVDLSWLLLLKSRLSVFIINLCFDHQRETGQKRARVLRNQLPILVRLVEEPTDSITFAPFATRT